MPDYPNRCQHLKINGTQCGSPALRRNRFCFFHKRFQDERIKLSADRARRGVPTFVLPVLEDANSIQIALMQVIRLLVAQQVDHKTASLLLYALQTASSNLRMTRFEPQRHDVVLDPRTVGDTPLDSNLWDDEDFEEEEDEPETAADRALAALETQRKKKEEDEKWRRWAEMQYPDPRMATASATVTPTGSARLTEEVKPDVTPGVNSATPPRKPAAAMDPAQVRQKISDMIRKEFLPGYKPPAGSKSPG
jgi:hypothetical protein